MKRHHRSLMTLVVPFITLNFAVGAWALDDDNLVFSVIADVPYYPSEYDTLRNHVRNHNLYSTSRFWLFLGDIKSPVKPCLESDYVQMADILKDLEVPVFMVPGDNEWVDCADLDQAWSWWEASFLNFEENFCNPPKADHQGNRPENVAFVVEDVLFVGLNIVHAPEGYEEEFQILLQQDLEWVTKQFQEQGPDAKAAVVFSHAGPSSTRRPFFDPFQQVAADFGKPILYIHADGHKWIMDQPFRQKNILRVQVDRGDVPPVEVTITGDPDSMFVFNREPWGPDSEPVDSDPCVPDDPMQVVGDISLWVPALISISPIYPNPFNLETSIEYLLVEDTKVLLRIFNSRGQLVRTLVNGLHSSGLGYAHWDGRDEHAQHVGTGVYFVRLDTTKQTIVRQVTLQK